MHSWALSPTTSARESQRILSWFWQISCAFLSTISDYLRMRITMDLFLTLVNAAQLSHLLPAVANFKSKYPHNFLWTIFSHWVIWEKKQKLRFKHEKSLMIIFKLDCVHCLDSQNIKRYCSRNLLKVDTTSKTTKYTRNFESDLFVFIMCSLLSRPEL